MVRGFAVPVVHLSDMRKILNTQRWSRAALAVQKTDPTAQIRDTERDGYSRTKSGD